MPVYQVILLFLTKTTAGKWKEDPGRSGKKKEETTGAGEESKDFMDMLAGFYLRVRQTSCNKTVFLEEDELSCKLLNLKQKSCMIRGDCKCKCRFHVYRRSHTGKKSRSKTPVFFDVVKPSLLAPAVGACTASVVDFLGSLFN